MIRAVRAHGLDEGVRPHSVPCVHLCAQTAAFRKAPEGGYVAFVEELPGANTQGATIDEARANLREAVELVLEANRELSEEDLAGPT